MGDQPGNLIVPLNTQYKDRLEVKEAGAKWNPESKIWTIDAYTVYNKPDFWLPHVNFDQLYSQAEASVNNSKGALAKENATKLVAYMRAAATGKAE